MNRLIFIFLLILSTCGLICNAEEIDACVFDQYVMGMLNEIAVSDNSTRHLELLDFIAEHGHKANAEICSDKKQREKLIRIAYTLYDEKKVNNETYNGYLKFNNVYPKYAFFAGKEEEGRIATNEDNAMYNLLLDYMIAKYDNVYAFQKKEMLKKHSDESKSLAYSIAQKLFTADRLMNIATRLAKSTSELATDLFASWTELWFQDESPLGRHEKFDYDYSWILNIRDKFLQKYPNTRYKTAIMAIMDDNISNQFTQYDRDDSYFSFGIGVSLGKSLKSSSLKKVDETLTAGFPEGRLQIRNFVIQFQDDLFIGKKTSPSFDLFLGYSFDFDKFRTDIMGGIGLTSFCFDNDSTTNLSYFGSAQIIKKLPLGDILYLSPKFQWVVKGVRFDDPYSNRKRWGVINHFLFGLIFEAQMPLSKLNTKDSGKKHDLIRRTSIRK